MKDSCVAPVNLPAIPPVIRIVLSYLLVHIQLPEDLGRVEQMRVLVYPGPKFSTQSSTGDCITHLKPFQAVSGRFRINAIQYPLTRNKKVRIA